MSDKRGSVKETSVSGGTTLATGQMVVRPDTNQVVVVPSGQSASTFAASLGVANVKAIDYPARVGAFPDTGKPIFEVL